MGSRMAWVSAAVSFRKSWREQDISTDEADLGAPEYDREELIVGGVELDQVLDIHQAAASPDLDPLAKALGKALLKQEGRPRFQPGLLLVRPG